MSKGYSVRQAAEMVGKSRKTLYHHISSGVLSASRDTQGNRVIDKAELLRVYGGLVQTPDRQGDSHPFTDQGEDLEQLRQQLEKQRHHNQLLMANLNATRREVDLLKQALSDAREREREMQDRHRATLSIFERLLPNQGNRSS